MNIKNINNDLNNGYIPSCFDYSNKPNNDYIDYNKLNYIDYYDFEYYARRFPKGFRSINGFEEIIASYIKEHIDNNNTPWDEMEKRKSIINLDKLKIE
jgi:hypothetical protein